MSILDEHEPGDAEMWPPIADTRARSIRRPLWDFHLSLINTKMLRLPWVVSTIFWNIFLERFLRRPQQIFLLVEKWKYFAGWSAIWIYIKAGMRPGMFGQKLAILFSELKALIKP